MTARESHGAGLKAPSAFIARFAHLVPAGGPSEGTVLDVACGGGRHARFFLALGHRVVAVDRDISGVADLAGEPRFTALSADLEAAPWPFDGRVFAAVVVTNYLHRPLFPALLAALEPGAVLLYETFARGNERFGHPRNPDYLLAPGELLEVARGRLQVVAYEHGYTETPRPMVVQRLCAINDLMAGEAGPPVHALGPRDRLP
ncbi:MAG: class I SAM-dependent methyltransferase [Alphaproteobacteria bacterium]